MAHYAAGVARRRGGVSVELSYDDRRFAELYDLLNRWGESDDFYLELVMSAEPVLDVGCGTGALLGRARASGHRGRLVGLDPADAMLDVARAHSGIDWVLGDLATVGFEREFDLILMSGHTFQVFLDDAHLRQTLGTVRRALKPGGRFAFETRNPEHRAWEGWTPDNPIEIDFPGGGVVRLQHHVELPVEGDIVRFDSTITSPGFEGVGTSRSTLRFLDALSVNRFLTGAGLSVEAQYGDWDRSPLTPASPEIITIARPG